jgi:ATP-dependent DNA helicase PIF1
LLRNLDPNAGLCNGTRLLVTRLLPNAIQGRILGGDHHGESAYVPRIKLDSPASAKLPFVLRRWQFPVRLGLALTINKAQGQSLATVGLCLTKPVFTHGQFYVGLSRARFKDGLKMLLEDSDEGRRLETKNIVYTDVLHAVANDDA